MMVIRVPTLAADDFWLDAKPLLEKAVDTIVGKYDIDDVLHLIQTGEYALWVIVDEGKMIAAFTTRIAAYPRGNAMCIDWIGGERMSEWIGIGLEALEEYSREFSCTHMEACGRLGFARVLDRHGWGVEYTALRKDLNHG